MSSDFHAYIPYVNNPELLKRAVDSVPELWSNLTIVDNSGYGVGTDLPDSVEIFVPPVPLSFSQSQNYFFRDARWNRRCKFILWLHNDCELPQGAALQMIERVRSYYAEGRKWGVAFSHYDIFSAVNLAMVDEVGGYDTNIFSYKADQDMYRRVQLAGWELVNTEIEVEAIKAGHIGSQTIKSDPKLDFINGITQAMAGFYYESKWMGDAGHEKTNVPFGRPDLFGKGK